MYKGSNNTFYLKTVIFGYNLTGTPCRLAKRTVFKQSMPLLPGMLLIRQEQFPVQGYP